MSPTVDDHSGDHGASSSMWGLDNHCTTIASNLISSDYCAMPIQLPCNGTKTLGSPGRSSPEQAVMIFKAWTTLMAIIKRLQGPDR